MGQGHQSVAGAGRCSCEHYLVFELASAEGVGFSMLDFWRSTVYRLVMGSLGMGELGKILVLGSTLLQKTLKTG